MVQGVFVFLMCYIIDMYGSGCVDISNVLYNIYMYGSGCVCISYVLYNTYV